MATTTSPGSRSTSKRSTTICWTSKIVAVNCPRVWKSTTPSKNWRRLSVRIESRRRLKRKTIDLVVVDDFNETCPLLEMMANKSMKPRHWERIATVTGHKFDIESDNFLLRDIMAAPLLKYKEDIEVSARRRRTREWPVRCSLGYLHLSHQRKRYRSQTEPSGCRLGQSELSIQYLQNSWWTAPERWCHWWNHRLDGRFPDGPGLPHVQSVINDSFPPFHPKLVASLSFASVTTRRSRRKFKNGCRNWPPPRRSSKNGCLCKICGSTWRLSSSVVTSPNSCPRKRNGSEISINPGKRSCNVLTKIWTSSVVAQPMTHWHSYCHICSNSWSCVKSPWLAIWKRNVSSFRDSSSSRIRPFWKSSARPVIRTPFK